MCSFATTEPGRLRKARMGVTSNLWIHWDDPSSFPLLRQSFAAGSLDPSLDASGWDRHQQAEGRAVAQGKARATAQTAAENPTPSLLLVLGTPGLHPSRLISGLHRRLSQEAGGGARIHGRVHDGDVHIIHVWHDKNFLKLLFQLLLYPVCHMN